MAEHTRRPPIRNVEVQTSENGKSKTRRGPDLNTVLKGILIQQRNDLGITTSELARRLGLRQQSLSAMLSRQDDRGFTLRLLSDICASLGVSAGELFEMHPQYGTKDESSWARLKSVTTEGQRDELAKTLELASTLGMVQSQIDHIKSTVSVVADVTREGKPRRGRKSG
jgi:DNA-binding Xre family transcriptional regulator